MTEKCQVFVCKLPLWLCFTALSAHAQQCPNQPAAGTSTTAFSVPPNSTVYYKFDASTNDIPVGSTPPPPTSQITAALNAWSSGDGRNGGSGTTFVMADSSHPAILTIYSNPAVKTYNAFTTANPGIINSSNPAAIIFYPNATFSGTSILTLQPSQPGYNTAFLATALHEIGHLQGILDYDPAKVPPPSPTTSVVAPTRGVNDQDDPYQKSGPTPCDVREAAYAAQSVATPPPPYDPTDHGGSGNPKNPHTVPVASPPDNGSGSGGGSGDCSGTEYYDNSTTTVYYIPC